MARRQITDAAPSAHGTDLARSGLAFERVEGIKEVVHRVREVVGLFRADRHMVHELGQPFESRVEVGTRVPLVEEKGGVVTPYAVTAVL